MKTYIIEPHDGVFPVKLNMKRDDVHKIMGNDYKSYYKFKDCLVDAYHNSGFQIFYTTEFIVEYIDLNRIMAKTHDIFCLEQNIFKTPANELIEIISKKYPYDETDKEIPYSFIFPQLDLSFWRPVLPENGSNDGLYFESVGIGVKDYYKDL